MVVNHLLTQRLTDALDGAAVELAAHDHRIDDSSHHLVDVQLTYCLPRSMARIAAIS
jgi:hypothetical protein